MSVRPPDTAPKKALPAAFAKNIWALGQSGNPTGKPGDQHAAVVRLARAAAPEAMGKLIDLMTNCRDPRIALVAAEKILERAYGKPREMTDKALATSERKIDIKAVMASATDEELKTIRAMFSCMIEMQLDLDSAVRAEVDVDSIDA